MIENAPSLRVFKTAWFSKVARKSRITDNELCRAIKQVMQGQADDLGGGVFKKRLQENRYRSIILAKAGQYWIYVYLFAKKDRDNIDDDELSYFKKLSVSYSIQSESIIENAINNGDLLEICNVKET